MTTKDRRGYSAVASHDDAAADDDGSRGDGDGDGGVNGNGNYHDGPKAKNGTNGNNSINGGGDYLSSRGGGGGGAGSSSFEETNSATLPRSNVNGNGHNNNGHHGHHRLGGSSGHHHGGHHNRHHHSSPVVELTSLFRSKKKNITTTSATTTTTSAEDADASASPSSSSSSPSSSVDDDDDDDDDDEGVGAPSPVVELSSLFRDESSLFRSEDDAKVAEELLVDRERKRRTMKRSNKKKKKKRPSQRKTLKRSNKSGRKEDDDDDDDDDEDGDDDDDGPAMADGEEEPSPIADDVDERKRGEEEAVTEGNFREQLRRAGDDADNGGGGRGSSRGRRISEFFMIARPSSRMLGSIREEDDKSDEEDEDPIMEVMDFLEDELDEHTYDDLIPLQIRMALEEQVFGWDHFLSNILGHVVYTAGSYLLTFWLITFVVLHEVPWGPTKSSADDGGDVGGEHGHHDNSPWGMPHELFSFVRTALSVGSAISTFRTIRRRRRVWLRHPYGSAEYLAEGRGRQRRESLREADLRARRFVLGSKLWDRMQRSYMKRRDKYLTRRVNRKLLKAQRMFESRHRNRVRLIQTATTSSLTDNEGPGGMAGAPGGGSGKKRTAVASALARTGHESSHHERVRMLAAAPGTIVGAGSGRKRQDSDDGYSSAGSGGGGSTAGQSSLGDDLTAEYYQNFALPGQYAMNSHTLPNFAIESVCHDQMPFAHGEIKRIPYIHGGFFGAAPFMLTNPHWISILRILMPDVYVEISRRASYAPAPTLIHWAENNPVVAAYGTAHEIEFSGRVPTLEWDVFLDPYLVRRVEIVLSEKEAYVQRQKDARKKSSESKAQESSAPGTEGGDGKSKQPSTPQTNAADERIVLSYYDKEIKRRTTLLVERMLIAHGNLAQLMMEHTGYLKKYNFSRVKRTRKTLGGGIYARQWLAVYSEAMKLGMGYEEEDEDGDDVSDSGTDGTLEEREYINFDKDAGAGEGKDDDGQVGSAHSEEDVNSPDSKSAPRSPNDEMFRTPDERGGGPPRKIVMMRSKVEDDDTDDGSVNSVPSLNSEPSLRQPDLTPRRSGPRRFGGRRKPYTPLEQGDADATSLHKAAGCPDKSIAESISVLKPIMQCSAPLGLLMDMKSRHVSRRVWALVIDFLRDCGARVEGIASFIHHEIRDISQYCSSPVNEIIFFHSAGDLQTGCHNGQVRRGDRVFFNAGSLLWDYPNLYDAEVLKKILWHRLQPCFDGQGIKEGYRLKPYAMTTDSSPKTPKKQSSYESESETGCDESTLDDGDSATGESLFTRLLIANTKKKSLSQTDFAYEDSDSSCSTIQQYKEYYQLSIGLYVQEFAIDEVAISLIVKYVNSNLHVYDLGLSWGGINGLTVKGIQPGRFTATDGLWNQRYGGMPWNVDLKPSSVVPGSDSTSVS